VGRGRWGWVEWGIGGRERGEERGGGSQRVESREKERRERERERVE